MNQYTGSCLCGDIHFEIQGDFESFFLCHCRYCQKDTGSAFAANLFSTEAQLNWLQGRDKVRTFNLPSTRHEKSFCEKCGSALPSLQMNGSLLVVPAGSLNVDVPLKPNAHIFGSSKASWEKDLHNLKTFETFPS